MERLRKELPSWGLSLFLNLSVLLTFHFFAFEPRSESTLTTTLDSVVEDVIPEENLSFTEAPLPQAAGNEGSLASLSSTVRSATSLSPGDIPLQERVEQILNPEMPQLAEASLIRLGGNIVQQVQVKGQSDDTPGGIQGAMDRVAYEVRQSLRDRKTLVIWLFDASGSLKDRREAIADRFDNIYRQLGETGTTEGLYSVVVSYGASSNLLTKEPLQDVSKLSDIVRKQIKEDKSGAENVFGTVRQVLDQYRTFRRSEGPWNKMIFIVTDERGDDADEHLEEVISLAKRSQTRVYTIGNAAVFGRKEGYVRWTYENGDEEDIAVDQGPETAFPDGIQLPFIGSGSDWRLRQMSSSYGPYALTRLCSETGGLYLITGDSQGYKFDRTVMRRYSPDYRPARQQEAEIKSHPAKMALVSVASLTYDHNLPLPQLTFRAYNDDILRREIAEAQKPVAEIDYALRRMFDMLSSGESARNSLKEERWRAAFDLAMGRILAMRVRYFGYNQMLANMKVSPQKFKDDKSNMWRLVPSDQIDTGPQMRKAAEQAKEYLQRCINENPGTPWALLAQRELSTDLGWSWKEYSEPIPGSDRLRASEPEVARLLLADEQRRQNRPRKQRPEHERPKL
ncbi:vWA domain-containing protein [Planctomicrobium sp. SH664]|uniref:vWA domain-containing protein n=1 Tax=Planctomicrobium sp. SH664 TaxID=3448125 RepID=UPI003F5B9BBD